MQQVFADCMVCTHGESEFSLQPSETASAMNNAMSQRIECTKFHASGRLDRALSPAGLASICISLDRL